MGSTEQALQRVSVRTWYYTAPNAGELYPVAARIPENAFRGRFDQASGWDPRWISPDGGLRILGAVMVLEARRPRAVIGFGRAYVPIYRDSPPSIVTSTTEFAACLAQLAETIVHRSRRDPAHIWPLYEFLSSHERPLPIRRALEMGDLTPWLVHTVLMHRTREGHIDYFDLTHGLVAGAPE